MFKLLYEYLLKYRSLSLPGLGRLHLEATEARADVTQQVIQPSQYHFLFEEGKFIRLGDLYDWLADREQIPETEAVSRLNEFSKELKASLNQGKLVSWNGVGQFSRREDGHLAFESETIGSDFLQPVKATKVIHEGATHTVLVGETETTSKLMEARLEPAFPFDERRPLRWWLIPLIVGLLLLMILAWYCSRHGFNINGAASHR